MEIREKQKILVIDDEESIRSLLRITLLHKGFDPLTAEDGERGIEIFKEERPSIVVTDIKMPGMDGLEVLKRIKLIDPDTRVIVITGHGDMESAIESLKQEASDFIIKPVKSDILMLAVKRAQETLWMKEKLREYTCNLEVRVKEATEELQKANDFQKNLIQSSIDGIMATDREGIIVLFNRGAEDLLGYRSERVINKMHIDMTAPPGVADSIREAFLSEEYGGQNRLVNYETVLMGKDGMEISVRISGTLLFDRSEVVGLVFFFQDLREIKRLQKELIAQERLSAIGQTIAGMAHYIKNILNGLEGGIYMVNTGFKRDRQQLVGNGWKMVQGNVQKISDLVMNMLNFSRDREPSPEPCNPNKIAQEICELMELKAKSQAVRLIRDFDDSIGSCLVDPGGIHRCLLNLITNAMEACTSDPKEKSWCVHVRTRKEKDGIRLEVEDNGMGMSEEVQERIFQKFFTTKGSRGSGFGLLVTRKIAEENGGNIRFHSEPGKGTVFSVSFPCKGADQIEG